MPLATDEHYLPPRNDAVLSATLSPKRKASENWWIASYSALRISDILSVGSDEAPDSPQAQKLFDDERLDPDAPRDIIAGGADIHRFPRGPNPGTFLHGLLEWAGEDSFAVSREALEDAIARRCNLRGWEGWITTLSDWLQHLLKSPLPIADGQPPVILEQLKQYRVEMEFWFASHKVDVVKLDELVRQYTHNGVARVAAEPVQLNGMFKGFIDLTFEHDGRYYVADYKSNWLGVDELAYTAQAMEQSILDNRYDLQYVLYLLALHRQLKARLPDYDYDRHIGGALYLFLRGTRADSRGVYFARPPRELIERLDRMFQGKPEPKAEPAWEQGVLRMSRTFDDLLPTPLTADSLSSLSPLTRAEDLLLLLNRWVERGWLRALDKAFVAFLHELEPDTDPLVLLAAALTSHQLGHGHVCLDLFETLKAPDFALSLPPEGDVQGGVLLLPSQLLETLDGAHWCKVLAGSPLVALAADSSDAAQQRPLVLSSKRLYLRRYWAYERRIDSALRQRLAQVEATPGDLPQRLDELFGSAKPG